MADFSYLNKYDVNESETREYPIVEIESDDGLCPTLTVKVATEANKAYRDGLMRDRGTVKSHSRINKKLSEKEIQNTRNADRRLYSETVVIGWKAVPDVSGNPVEFNVENCRQFLEALPNWVFDRLRMFCTDPANFTQVIDTEEKAGN